MYLDYIRRRNNLNNDPSGTARQTISQAYEFVLKTIGIDRDAGFIWKDYIKFLQSGPGTPGGTTWQDQQKMDSLRKAYRQAIVIPMQDVESIWRDYYAFETQLNAVTVSFSLTLLVSSSHDNNLKGRKFIQEKSPGYTSAKQAFVQLLNLTRGLSRSTKPKLPPAIGFDGDVEYMEQLEMWKKWIQWEKRDPLDLKDEDKAEYNKRILYIYKQATITLRFEPEFWYEAAEYSFSNEMDQEGVTFLESGIQANPESCLLSFKLADRIEMTSVKEDGQEAQKRRGDQVRAPYENLLDALYNLITVNKTREEKSIARVQETFAQRMASSPEHENDNEEEHEAAKKALQEEQDAQIKAISAGCEAQVDLLRKTLSFGWIALMRAMRRVQGKGKVGDAIGGMRSTFNQARKRGRLTSDVYVASSLLEHYCYKDPAATRILDRGLKLFPEDENFALEYIKHLLDTNDSTNARAVFETVVNKFAQKPELVQKAKPLYIFFHHWESHYGELSQVVKLEQRMKELFPNDSINLFAHRFQTTVPQVQPFDPTAVRPIISLRAQARPKILQSIEQHPSPATQQNDSPAPFSPRPANAHLSLPDQQVRISPKRPFESVADDLGPPRKVARGESPFKGAAGQRVRQAKGGSGNAPSLPRDVNFFLSILPRADQSQYVPKINNQALLTLLRHVNLGQVQHQAVPMAKVNSGQGYQAPQYYGR